MARNTIINKGRKKQEAELPAPQYDDDDNLMNDISEILFSKDNMSTPETEYIRSLIWQEFEAALSELPPEQREVFELTELEGLAVKDISNSTGIPVNTLLSRKHYAVKYLRKRLENLYKDVLNC